MKKFIVLVLLGISYSTAKAQEIETILLASSDASRLAKGFLNPVAEGLMFSMNTGWAHTAKVHKKFGFDITIATGLSFTPSDSDNFAFNTNDYQYLSIPTGETELPTVLSENDSDTQIDISIPTEAGTFKVANFDMPGGIANDLPLNATPAPIIQAGLGLPFKTDIKVRFIPNINFDDSVETNLIGFGVQHDLTQYLGKFEKLPFNLSILGAFTQLNASYNIDDQNVNDNVSTRNGEIDFELNSWIVKAIASLDFKIITIYGNFGYNSGNTTIAMNGDYTLSYDLEDSNGNTIGTTTETVSNPLSLDFDVNSIRAGLGARLNIGFFKIFADYTLQQFNTATVGIALSFR